MEQLTGKVAVVTGAASGIGLALTHAFLAEGMRVVMADIEAGALEAAAADLPEGAETAQVVCDVSDAAQVEALRDAAVERFGTVHVVCNNAGVGGGGPVWQATVEDWDWVLGANLYGVIHGVRAFTPLMIEQGEGHIVNTASAAGLISSPFMGTYNVSKHAVVTLSETLHGDLAMSGAEGVGVSVLCPAFVKTQIHLSARNRPGAGDREPTEEERAMFALVEGLVTGGIDAKEVAAAVVSAIRERRFYILTHPEVKRGLEQRVEAILGDASPPTNIRFA